MRAEILTIGDELCRGEIVDTNSSYLAGKLWDLAITTRWMTSCTDDERDIAAAVETAVARADVVVCSGGLGPTEDDLTVEVVAKLAGLEVVVDEPARARMEARFAVGRIPLTPIQLRQVRVPAGARVHGNPAGLAPCFEVALRPRVTDPGGRDSGRAGPRVTDPSGRDAGRAGPRVTDPSGRDAGRAREVPVVCLPGVPRELHAIWDGGLEARLRELRGANAEHIARQIYRVFGRGESQISQACRGIVDAVAGASIHYQVKFPETLVKLVVRDADQAAADARLAAMEAVVRERLAGFLYGTGDEVLVERVARRLVAAGSRVATAESCTGGLIGELLTRVPGSSRYYVGGAITYANAEKVRQLGVSEATLAAHGAVSEPCVREMAEGARARFGVELAVAVSGVAGPDGGTPDKPVGTVWLALATRRGTTTKHLTWPGARDQIRTLASWWALKLLDDALPVHEAALVRGAAKPPK